MLSIIFTSAQMHRLISGASRASAAIPTGSPFLPNFIFSDYRRRAVGPGVGGRPAFAIRLALAITFEASIARIAASGDADAGFGFPHACFRGCAAARASISALRGQISAPLARSPAGLLGEIARR